MEELEAVCGAFNRPYVIFRDPLFSVDRDRAMALADGIRSRGLDLRFECETRIDRLDPELLDALHGAGLRAMNLGVESLSGDILQKVGLRPTPGPHHPVNINRCRPQ